MLATVNKPDASSLIHPHPRLWHPHVQALSLPCVDLCTRGLAKEPDGALHDHLRIRQGCNMDGEVICVLVGEWGNRAIWKRNAPQESPIPKTPDVGC
jgi:hypothetical protein